MVEKQKKEIELCDRFEFEEQDNEDISYCFSMKIRHYIVELFLSDYGQCYFIKYKNLNTGEVDEVGLGTYNFNYLEEILSLVDNKGLYASMDALDVWETSMRSRELRGLPSIDYDDYDVYDIEGFYEKHK